MKICFSVLLVSIAMNLFGQAVNEKITLQLSQAALLRVYAGADINLSESGSVILGEAAYVNGGTPEFAFSWIDEDNREYNEKNPEVFNAGKYILIATDNNNCTASDSLTVFDFGTGVHPDFNIGAVNISIDVFSGTLLVKMEEITGTIKLSIVSLEGKVVYFDSIYHAGNIFEHRVDLNEFNKGIYLILVQGDKEESVRKFVVY